MYSPLNPLVKARLIQQKVENWKSVCAPCTHCVRLLVPWWTVAHQAPLPMEFSGRKYWSGLPFPIPGCLPDPGIQPAPLASPELAGGFFSSAPPGKPWNWKDGMLFALEKCFVLGFLFCCSYCENEFWNSGTLRKSVATNKFKNLSGNIKEWRSQNPYGKTPSKSVMSDVPQGFPGGSVVRNLPVVGDGGWTSESGRSPGEGNGNPLQYSCLGNAMDRGVWWATVHGVTRESDTS